jgi:hypothetical protein
MAKKDRRRHLVQPRGPQQLYVIAGLPLATVRGASEWLRANVKDAIVQAIPSSSDDGPLYPEALVGQIVRSVGSFAIRRRTKGPERPATPATITLLYVPASDDERLLAAFDFAVMVAPLTSLVSRDDKARQRRHILSAIEQELADASDAAGAVRQGLYEVVQRLGRQADNEAMLLPPRNFAVGDHDLVPAFRAFRLNERAWTDRLPDLGPTDLTHDDIARIPAKRTRRVFVDSRGMAFLIAHQTAYDGPPREAENDEDIGELLSTLRSLYRFGGALAPGLHHDAQRSDGSVLDGAIFHCDRDGRVSANGDYANIYPNDYVRVHKKTKVG